MFLGEVILNIYLPQKQTLKMKIKYWKTSGY